MTPRLIKKRPGCVVCLVAAISSLLSLSSPAQDAATPDRAGRPDIAQKVQQARTNTAAHQGLTNYVSHTVSRTGNFARVGSHLPPSVTDSEAAKRMMQRVAAERQPAGPPGTVVSNGVVVIREAAVAPPDTPLSKDPMVAVQQINARWTEKQHNLIYADPELKRLNDEIRRMEQDLFEKRQRLDAKLAANPEMAKINEERKKAFESVMAAKQRAHPVAPAAQP